MKKISLLILLIFNLILLPAFSQSNNFPQGSAQGTTQMNQNIRGVQIPNVAVQITQPQNGQEVAFEAYNINDNNYFKLSSTNF